MDNVQEKSFRYKGSIDDIKRESGIVTIAISKFDVEDYAGDIVRKGAFAKSFADMSRIKHCVDHYQDLDHVVGTPRKGWETDEYAMVESALILGTTKGHDIFEYYKHCADEGRAVEHSYCYRTLQRNHNSDIAGEDIAELELRREYSTVLAGCNPFTPAIDVKGLITIDQVIDYQNNLINLLRKCDFTDVGGKKIEGIVDSLKSALAMIEEKQTINPAPKEIIDIMRKSFL